MNSTRRGWVGGGRGSLPPYFTYSAQRLPRREMARLGSGRFCNLRSVIHSTATAVGITNSTKAASASFGLVLVEFSFLERRVGDKSIGVSHPVPGPLLGLVLHGSRLTAGANFFMPESVYLPNNRSWTVTRASCFRAGMEIELMPDDPFVTCLFDVPGIAVWRHDDAPVGTTPRGEPAYYVVSIAEGYPLPDDSIIGAMRAMPDGAPFLIELA